MKEGKEVRIIWVDKDSALAQSYKFFKFVQKNNISFEITGGYIYFKWYGGMAKFRFL